MKFGFSDKVSTAAGLAFVCGVRKCWSCLAASTLNRLLLDSSFLSDKKA